MGEEHLHLSDGFLTRHLMFGLLIELPNKLIAILYHLIHCTLLRELSVLVAIFAIVLILCFAIKNY